MCCAPGLALAQSADTQASETVDPTNEATQIDEIIVTAQRRSERLRDIPFSVTAVQGEELLQQGVTDVAQLQKVVPGLSVQQSTLGVPIYSIRGIGFYDTAVTASPTVTTYVDQIPLAYSAETRGAALDVQRVEVLKGPQGTLFGLNATGGAINFVANKPTDQAEAGFDLDAGRFDTFNAQGFVSGPIAPNLNARLALRAETRGDWQESLTANDALFGKTGDSTLGERRFYSGRFLLDWTPSDRVGLEFNLNGWKDNSDTQAAQYLGFYPAAPADPFNAAVYAALGDPRLITDPGGSRVASWDAGRDYSRDDYFYQLSINGHIDLTDQITLSSISAYSKYKEDSFTDPDGLAYNDLGAHLLADIESYYQELRLSGDSGRFKWMLGANYAEDTTTEVQVQYLQGTQAHLGPFPYPTAELRNHQEITTVGVFGSLDYKLTDELTLQASVRYTDQDRDYAGCLADSGDGLMATAIGAIFGAATSPGACLTQTTAGVVPPVIVDSLPEDNVSWRASLNWKPAADTTVYASASTGYKAGGYSLLPAVFAVQLTPATQESVLAYELGARTAFAERRVQLSGAVFYSDYDDKQITGSIVLPPFGPLPILLNIPRSRVWGAELEAILRPISGLAITAGVTYVNSRIEENPSDPLDVYGYPANFIGESFPNTPEWQGVVDAQYDFALSGRLNGFVGATFSARSSTATALGNSNTTITGLPGLEIDGYGLLDLRAGVETADGAWRFQVWGRNVTDETYATNRIKQVDTLSEFVGMPATYGVTLSYRFR
ncbi:TonB-dependent receptor [uncultured Brevundimonas sp.]|uniref:TonB-dependent receptor n=1 Tax=uncultured Brevundimonas sp. TaxID=213418 RepID=UPI0025CF670A|nr:TonB-dependent receptor [uncultured Brevundimonas sp.]